MTDDAINRPINRPIDLNTGKPMEPVGWQPGLDWEVRDGFAELYDVTWSGDMRVATVRARSPRLLCLKMFVAQWRYRRAAKHHTGAHREAN